MSSLAKPTVIIYENHLLGLTETFVQAQTGALSQFDPVFAGSRRIPGLDVREEQIFLLNRGGFWATCGEIGFKLTGFAGWAPGFIRRLSALRPVLLHAHHGPNGIWALPIVRNLKIPLVVTFHGSDITITDLRFEKPYLGFRYFLANKGKLKASGATFLAVSRFVQEKVLAQGFPPENVHLVYTGINTAKFRPDSSKVRPIILVVGRCTEQKGQEFAIKAVSEVQRQLPEAELVLIGDGPLRSDLERFAKQSLRRYRFLGACSSEEVRQWMSRASLLCMPSVTTRSGAAEGFGMVCAEAQAMGKPVVAFRSGAIPEIISHGISGFLAEERDWKALAEYISMILQDAELGRRFGRAGRECMLRQFDLEQCTRHLEKVYWRVLDADRQRGRTSDGTLPRWNPVSNSHGEAACSSDLG
jgi:glycosyltransferase involved in cell wall biosynthesis